MLTIGASPYMYVGKCTKLKESLGRVRKVGFEQEHYCIINLINYLLFFLFFFVIIHIYPSATR